MLLLKVLTIVLYTTSWIWLCYNLFHEKLKPESPHTSIQLMNMLAALSHAIVISQNTLTEFGLNTSIWHVFSFVCWVAVMIYLFIGVKKPIETFGVFILPITALSMLFQVIWPDSNLINKSLELDSHILLSLLAYGLLSIAAGQSVLLGIQNYYLKRKQPGGFIRAFPPLQSMESLLFSLIGAGFAVLTLALFSGFLFLEDIFAQHLVHKTVLSLIAWLIFAILLWGRWHFGWRGKKAVQFTLSGFIFLMLAYFGSKVVLELILHRI